MAEFKDKGVQDLAVAHAAALAAVGARAADTVDIKAATGTPEATLAVLRKLGAPEGDASYGYKPAEGIDPKVFEGDFGKAFEKVAKDAGLLPSQYAKIMDSFGQFATKALADEAPAKVAERRIAEGNAAFQKAYPTQEARDAFTAEVSNGLSRLPPEYTKRIHELGLEFDLDLARGVAEIGKMFGDTVPSHAAGSAGSSGPDMTEYNRFLALSLDPKASAADKANATAQLATLGKKLFGTKVL